MDTYEKKYKEALEWMRELYPGLHGATKEDAEHYFPELAESEDERIRKEIINYLDFAESHNLLRAADYEKKKGWLSYLEKQKDAFENGRQLGIMQEQARQELGWPDEKQKEQKPNYCHHEVDETGWTEEYRKAYYDGWNNCNMQHEQLKAGHKPAEWSEEDELMRTVIIQTLERFGGRGTTEMQIDWLKSIRPHWKPSEEQMKALQMVRDSHYFMYQQDRVSIETLLEQLKAMQ